MSKIERPHFFAEPEREARERTEKSDEDYVAKFVYRPPVIEGAPLPEAIPIRFLELSTPVTVERDESGQNPKLASRAKKVPAKRNKATMASVQAKL